MKNLIYNKKRISIILALLLILAFGFSTNILKPKVENIPGGHFTQVGTVPPFEVNFSSTM